MITQTVFGILFPFFMTTAGAAVVFFVRKAMTETARQVIFGLSGGIMTAASVWSMILPALACGAKELLCAITTGGVLLGAVCMLLLERLAQRQEHRSSGFLLYSAITLHNVPEGMAVGLGYAVAMHQGAYAAAFALAFGIGIQNFPEGAAISLPMHNAGCGKTKSFLLSACSGAVEPIFAAIVLAASSVFVAIMPWMLSFAAGCMLYVVVAEMVPLSHEKTGTLSFIAGFLIMMILDVLLG